MTKYVIEKTLSHNLTDRSEYSNLAKAIQNFVYMPGNRKLGVKSDCGNVVFLIATAGNSIKLINIENKEEYRNLRENILIKSLDVYRKKISDEAEELLRKAEVPTSSKREINFQKEIKKKKRCCKKLFKNNNFMHYDFRNFDLSEAIFINCDLEGANFSGCNLRDAAFINCNIDSCIWQDALVNDANYYITGEKISLRETEGYWKGRFCGRV